MFPDYRESFAEFERPPTDFDAMDEAAASDALDTRTAAELKSTAGQSLLRGQVLHEIADLQIRQDPISDSCTLVGYPSSVYFQRCLHYSALSARTPRIWS